MKIGSETDTPDSANRPVDAAYNADRLSSERWPSALFATRARRFGRR